MKKAMLFIAVAVSALSLNYEKSNAIYRRRCVGFVS